MKIGNIEQLIILVSLLISSQVSSTPIFSDRSAWERALTGDKIFSEDFNGSVASPSVFTKNDSLRFSNGLTLTGSGNGGLGIFKDGIGSVFDSPHLETDFEFSGTLLHWTFESQVFAIGFDYAQANYVNSIWVLGIGDLILSPPPNASNNETAFFGFIADSPFDSFSITTGARDQDYKVDDISFAVSVPEPDTLGLVLLGSFMVIFIGIIERKNISYAD